MAGTAKNKKAPATDAVEAKAQTITVGVKSVRVYSADDNIRYRVQFDTMIDAIVRDRETDEYVESQVDYIDFVPSVIIAQCLNIVDGLDLMYTKKKEQSLRNGSDNGFGATELQVVLGKAKMTLERTRFEAGDEYTDRDDTVQTHEYAGYNTNITAIKVSERIQVKLDALIDSIFDL